MADLPELPAPDEQRLQRAAALLQQRLVLRQWLNRHKLDQHYPRYLFIIPNNKIEIRPNTPSSCFQSIKL